MPNSRGTHPAHICLIHMAEVLKKEPVGEGSEAGRAPPVAWLCDAEVA